MKTFEELRQQAEAIRDAVNENENSAERVGGHLLDTVEKMESLDNRCVFLSKNAYDALEPEQDKVYFIYENE